jgi:hypothetical protein
LGVEESGWQTHFWLGTTLQYEPPMTRMTNFGLCLYAKVRTELRVHLLMMQVMSTFQVTWSLADIGMNVILGQEVATTFCEMIEK